MSENTTEIVERMTKLLERCQKMKGDLAVAINILSYQSNNPTPNVLSLKQVLGILREIDNQL